MGIICDIIPILLRETEIEKALSSEWRSQNKVLFFHWELVTSTVGKLPPYHII